MNSRMMWPIGIVLSIGTFFIKNSQISILLSTVAVSALVLGAENVESLRKKKLSITKWFFYLGVQSGFIFLIHYPVLTVFGNVLLQKYYDGSMREAVGQGLICGFITIVLAAFYSHINGKIYKLSMTWENKK